METIDEKTVTSLRNKCKASLFFLARAVLGFKDLDKDIHRPICKALEDYHNNARLLVVLPRTWFKSSLCSIAYPIWRAINNPDVRILIAQNTMTNAKKKILSIKNIFETNELLRALFPEILPEPSSPWSSECLTLNRRLSSPEGTFEPAGTGTAVTSRHYDVIVEDDTVAPDFDALTGDIQQPTQMEIEKAIGWHKLCYPLLLHPLRSQILIVGTRWAPDDLIHWILINGRGYKMISRSALEFEGRIGEPASREQGGIPIWERFNEQALEELETSMGPFLFSTLYLNSPSTALNQVFKRSYIKYYENIPRDLLYCTSIDPSPSDSQGAVMDSDYSVVLTTGIKPSTGEVFVINYFRGRVDPGELIDTLFSHYRAYKPLIVMIESVAYQKTLCYWVRRRQEHLNERFYIEEVKNAKTSKAARILGLQPWFAANKVRMRTEHADLERELLSFDPGRKYGGHDDVIDALSMQISFWSNSCENYRVENREEKVIDPFTGESIINELLGRPAIVNKYPYDMGNMKERALAMLPRTDYAYN